MNTNKPTNILTTNKISINNLCSILNNQTTSMLKDEIETSIINTKTNNFIHMNINKPKKNIN